MFVFGGVYYTTILTSIQKSYKLLELKPFQKPRELKPRGPVVVFSLPETNMTSPLKMDGWNTILSYWVKRPIFKGEPLVSGRVSFGVIIKDSLCILARARAQQFSGFRAARITGPNLKSILLMEEILHQLIW